MTATTDSLPRTGKDLEATLERDFETVQAQYKRKVKAGQIADILTLTVTDITDKMLWNVCNVCYPSDPNAQKLNARLSVNRQVTDKLPTRQPTRTDNADTPTDNADTYRQVTDKLKKEIEDRQNIIENLNNELSKARLEVKKNTDFIFNLEKDVIKADAEAEKYKQAFDFLKAQHTEGGKTITDITDKHNQQLTDIQERHDRQLTDITDNHKVELSELSAQMSAMSERHETALSDIQAQYDEARKIILESNSKKSFFQLARVVLVCFVGVVVYQSYETSLGLLLFHAISGKEIPYFLAIGCAVLIGLFGIILTMNTPKNEWGEYDMTYLRNYDIGIFLLNLYVFLPAVIQSPTTHFQDYAATLLYCATMPFIEYTFGSIYLSKKQEQENRINAVTQ